MNLNKIQGIGERITEKIIALIRKHKALTIALIVFLIIPGIWTIFFFNKEKFWELDVIKLIVISISISMPIFACDLVTLICTHVLNKIEKDLEIIIFKAIISTIIIFAIVFGFKMAIPSMKVEHAIGIMIGCIISIGIANYFDTRKI